MRRAALAWGFVWATAWAASGCGAAGHYHLRIDAQRSEASALCRADAEGAATNCEALEGQTLEAPGQLSVSVVNARAGASYELRLDETRLAAGVGAPADVIQQFLRNLSGLTGLVGGTLLGRVEPEGTGPLSRSILREQIEEVAAGVAPALRDLISRAAPEMSVNTPETTVSVNGFTVPAEGSESAVPLDDGGVVPFVRAHSLRPQHLTLLAEQGHDGDAIARVATVYCRREAWGEARGFGVPVATLAAQRLNPEEVLAALGLDPSSVVAALRGDPLEIEARIRARLTAADVEIADDRTLTGDAAVVRRLVVEAAFAADLERCRGNLELIARELGRELSAERRAALASALLDVTELEGLTHDARESYALFVRPFLTERALAHLRSIASTNGHVDFGTRTLRAGSVHLVVHERGASEHEARPLADLDVQVHTSPRLGVSVGPLLTFCDSCLRRVENVIAPATGTGMEARPAGRVIRESSNSVGGSAAISLHLTLAALDRASEHHLGFMLGYPIGEATGTPASALGGVSYRFVPLGLQVAVGIQLFESVELSTTTSMTGREVDLRLAGNELLTVDDVTTSRLGVAGFVMAGISFEILSSL